MIAIAMLASAARVVSFARSACESPTCCAVALTRFSAFSVYLLDEAHQELVDNWGAAGSQTFIAATGVLMIGTPFLMKLTDCLERREERCPIDRHGQRLAVFESLEGRPGDPEDTGPPQ